MSGNGTMKPFFLSSGLVAIAMLFAPVNVRSERRSGDLNESSYSVFRNGLSVTYEYLPARYPYPYNNSTTVNGQGLGLDYKLSIPMSFENLEFMTGLGFSYIRIDDSGEYHFALYSYDQAWIYIQAECSIERSYCYAYLPVGFGYKIAINDIFHITPFVGMRAKYNISYIEKHTVESASFFDLYYDLFDEQIKTEDSKRFIFQAESGLEIGFRNLFVSFSYSRDMSRFFRIASYKNGPYTFNCWQAGIGVYF